MANSVQLNSFLKSRKGANCNWREIEMKENNDLDRNTEITVTIIGGIGSRELNVRYGKAQIRQLSQVKAAKELKPLVQPTMVVGPEDMCPPTNPS